jgi:hypothetical protein
MTLLRFISCVAAAFLAYGIAAGAPAPNTAFTYQGRLSQNGQPATGSFDLQFTPAVSATGSPVAGLMVVKAPVAVVDGQFTVSLDFGEEIIIEADELWLEIGVRTNGSAAPFEILAPRQKVAPTPHAIRASHYTGPVQDSQLSGNIARLDGGPQVFRGPVQFTGVTGSFSGSFTGNAAGLTNLDSSSLTGPLKLSEGHLIPVGAATNRPSSSGWLNDVAVRGDYAYGAFRSGGLLIYNIAAPHSPFLVGQNDETYFVLAVAISGDHAFLATEDAGLEIIDISVPTNPVRVGSTGNANISGIDVAVQGEYAYVACQDQGLRVYRVSNPALPALVREVDDGGSAESVAVSGNYAYLANGSDGLRIYDLSDPANPVGIGHGVTGSGNFLSVAVQGDFAYLAVRGASDGDLLLICDISNKAFPQFRGSAIHPGAWRVAVSGQHAYLSSTSRKVAGFDVSRPDAPGLVSEFEIPGIGSAFGLTAVGGYLYVACGQSGLRILGTTAVVAPAFVTASGNDVTVDAGNLSTGTLSDARLSANVALLDATQTFTGSNRFAGPVDIEQGLTLGVNPAAGGYTALLAGLSAPTNGFAYLNAVRASGSAWGNLVLNQFAGNVGIGMAAPTNKLQVAGAVAATAFVTLSDRNAKTNLTPVNVREVLAKVASLPITRWTFKDLPDGPHLGPMAQDFHAAFGLGGGGTTITSVDADGVALAAIQGLHQKLEEQLRAKDAEMIELRQSIAELRRTIENLIATGQPE